MPISISPYIPDFQLKSPLSHAPSRRAIAIDPEEGDAHYNLGVLLENHKEDYDGAEQHYRRAIAIDPEDGHAHYNLGVLLGS